MRRAWVPTSEVREGHADLATLDAGISEGLPWEELLTLRVTPERVAAELRRRGIWTAGDLRRNPNAAIAALQAAYALDVQTLLAAAEKHEQEALK